MLVCLFSKTEKNVLECSWCLLFMARSFGEDDSAGFGHGFDLLFATQKRFQMLVLGFACEWLHERFMQAF